MSCDLQTDFFFDLLIVQVIVYTYYFMGADRPHPGPVNIFSEKISSGAS